MVKHEQNLLKNMTLHSGCSSKKKKDAKMNKKNLVGIPKMVVIENLN